MPATSAMEKDASKQSDYGKLQYIFMAIPEPYCGALVAVVEGTTVLILLFVLKMFL